MEHMVWMDSNVIPGAFYAEAVWFWPQARPEVIDPEEAKKRPGIPPHSHPFPELLSYYGTDMAHPEELYCEVEFWMEDEKYVFEKSFVVYIPEGVVHCPIKMHNMKKPIFHFGYDENSIRSLFESGRIFYEDNKTASSRYRIWKNPS